MSQFGVLFLMGDAERSDTAAALTAAARLSGGDVRTMVLGASPPAGPVPAGGTVEAGVVPGLDDVDSDGLYRAARQMIGSAPPDVLLIAQGRLAQEVGARLAGSLGYSCALDLESCEAADGSLTMTRSVFGGKATQHLRAPATGLVLAFRSGAVEAAPAPSADAQVRDLTAPEGVLEERRRAPQAGPDLTQAKLVVSGGRGVGGAEGFEDLAVLANCLGGAVGASRAAVDEGWAAPEQQVGLTGLKVAPELYLAVGISGASQHLMGMSGARTVLAVNKDDRAPIVEAADVAFIADWHALWPHLKERLGLS